MNLLRAWRNPAYLDEIEAERFEMAACVAAGYVCPANAIRRNVIIDRLCWAYRRIPHWRAVAFCRRWGL